MTLPRQKLEIGQCNCFAIRKAARTITRLYDNFLQPTGLRITQFLILATLVEVGSNSVNGLAERLDLERTAMGKTLAPLERDGLIRITSSRTDGRSRIAALTPQGKRVFDTARPRWREAQHRLADLNGEHWMGGLRYRLSKMGVGDGQVAPSVKKVGLHAPA
jgi:DNA-binding MarR family transcriptional regulator